MTEFIWGLSVGNYFIFIFQLQEFWAIFAKFNIFEGQLVKKIFNATKKSNKNVTFVLIQFKSTFSNSLLKKKPKFYHLCVNPR